MLFIFLIIIGLLYYNYIYSQSSEDEFHKKIHKVVNNINDSPIVKFTFDNNKSYNIAYNNLLYNEVFARHDYDILRFKPFFNSFCRFLTKKMIFTKPQKSKLRLY